MRLYSIRLLVEDFDACFRFYRDLIGLEPAWGEEGGRYADFKAGNGTFLALFKRDLMAATVSANQLQHDTPTQDRAALVFQTDDLDGTAAELQCKSVDFVNEPKDYPVWTIRAAHLRDPDGNLIELFAPLPKEKWTQDVRDEDLRSKARR